MYLLLSVIHLWVTVWCLSTVAATAIVGSGTASMPDVIATTPGLTLPQISEREMSATVSPTSPVSSPSPSVLSSSPLLLVPDNGHRKSPLQARIQSGSTVQGWPTLLEIEVDELELGGLTMPSIQSVIQNLKVGSKNFGNVNTSTPFPALK